MPRLTRRISVTALAAAGSGTVVNTANSVGSLPIPQQQVLAMYVRQLGGLDIDWRMPAVDGYAQSKITILGKEVGVIDGISRPQDVELFLAAGNSTPTEVQVVIDYQDKLA